MSRHTKRVSGEHSRSPALSAPAETRALPWESPTLAVPTQLSGAPYKVVRDSVIEREGKVLV